MKLLHAFILKHAPTAYVNTQHSWPKGESLGNVFYERLRAMDPAFPRQDGLAYLLFDEGQDLYEDDMLWNRFFKEVVGSNHSCYRIILFCSYGSPSSQPVPYRRGTPLVLRQVARISLWPQQGLDGLDGSIGILLNRSEFDEVVSRFERSLVHLHQDLLDLIFGWTVGHAGAVVEMLRVISYQVSLCSKSHVSLSCSCLLTLFPRE